MPIRYGVVRKMKHVCVEDLRERRILDCQPLRYEASLGWARRVTRKLNEQEEARHGRISAG